MNTQGMYSAVRDLRNRNTSAMDALGCEHSTSADPIRTAVAEALAAVGVPGGIRTRYVEQVGQQAAMLFRALEQVHYATDGLASAMDDVNQRLKHRGADPLF